MSRSKRPKRERLLAAVLHERYAHNQWWSSDIGAAPHSEARCRQVLQEALDREAGIRFEHYHREAS